MPVSGSVSHGFTSGAATSLTISHTADGNPLYVLLSWFVSSGGTETASIVTGVTFNGVGLTRGGHAAVAGNTLEWWRILTPTAGTYNVVISASASRRLTAAVLNLTGWPDALARHRFAYAGAFAGTTQPTVTVDTASGNDVIDWLGWNDNTQNVTAGAGQTELWNQEGTTGGGAGDAGDQGSSGSRKVASATTATMSWTCAVTAEYWGLGALSFRDSAATFEDGDPGTLVTAELTTRSSDVLPYAEVDLNDAETYYDGYKAPKLLQVSPISRGLSDVQGRIQHASFGVELSDADRSLRGLLDDATDQYLANCPLVIRTVSDDDRRAELPMRVEMSGYVSEYEPRQGLRFGFEGIDWLKKRLAKANKKPEYWQPLLTRTDFKTLPADLINKAAPLVYGKVSDEVSATIDPELYPRNSYDPGWTEFGYNGWATGTLSTQNYYVYVTTIFDGVESMRYAFPFSFAANGASPAFHVRFLTSRTPTYFRIYLSDSNEFEPFTNPLAGTFARYVDIEPDDAPTTVNPYGGATGNRYYLIDSETVGADYQALVVGSGATAVVPARGACPTLYVGEKQVDGESWGEFLICRGAVKDVIDAFVGGVRVTSYGLATDVLCPFQTDYATELGAQYVDINGRRYTTLYAKGNVRLHAIDGSAPITVNVWGYETVGDGSGTLLTSPVLQHQHFVTNFLAPDAMPDTTWLADAEDLPIGTPCVNEDSYDETENALQARISGGYESAGIIGAKGEHESALDILSDFQVCGDFEAGIDRLGRIMVTAEPNSAPATATEFDDILKIVDRSFSARATTNTNFFNVQPYRHTQDYTGRTRDGWFLSGESRDAASITNYTQEREAPQIDLRFLRANTAQAIDTILDVVQRRRLRYRHPLRTVTLTVPFLDSADVELGDVLRLDHIEGVSASGWVGHDVRVLDIETDLGQWVRKFTCYDLDPIYAGLDDAVEPTEYANAETDTITSLQQNAQNTELELADVQAQLAALDAEVTALGASLATRQTVRAATTANITISTALNNGDTLDGVTLATSDLVLVKDQSSASENGIYVVGVSPARSTLFDTYNEHPGALITVQEGTTNADTLWLCTSNVGGTLNTTAISFAQFTSGTASGADTYTGTYASPPGSPNTGDLWMPSNSFYISRYGGSAWVPWGPIFPCTDPSLLSFTWTNQGSAAVDTTYGGIYLSVAANAGASWRIRKKTAPATPWTVTMMFLGNGIADNSTWCLLFRESSTGRLHTIHKAATSTNLRVTKWTNPSTVSANYVDITNGIPSGRMQFFQISDDGSNRISRVSSDGQHWIQVHSVGRTDFLTADEWGFAVFDNATYDVGMTVLSLVEA